jgi:hypothetical protein
LAGLSRLPGHFGEIRTTDEPRKQMPRAVALLVLSVFAEGRNPDGIANFRYSVHWKRRRELT